MIKIYLPAKKDILKKVGAGQKAPNVDSALPPAAASGPATAGPADRAFLNASTISAYATFYVRAHISLLGELTPPLARY